LVPAPTTSDTVSEEEFVNGNLIKNGLRNNTTTTSDTADTASKEDFVADQLVPAPSDSSNAYQETGKTSLE
jgi:hypothetical protein